MHTLIVVGHPLQFTTSQVSQLLRSNVMHRFVRSGGMPPLIELRFEMVSLLNDKPLTILFVFIKFSYFLFIFYEKLITSPYRKNHLGIYYIIV